MQVPQTLDEALRLGAKPIVEAPATLQEALKAGATPITDTLLQSRQQASKSEFEANRPESTVLSRMREAAIGALEPFTAGSVAHALAKTGKAILQGPQIIPTPEQVDLLHGVVMAPIEPVKNFVSGIAEGDYDKAAYGSGGILTQTVPAVDAAVRAVKPLPRAATEAATSPEALRNRAAANREATSGSAVPSSTTPHALAKAINNLTRPARAALQEALAEWMEKDSRVPRTTATRAAALADEAARLRQAGPLPPDFEPWRSTPSEPLNIPRPSTPQFVDSALGRMNKVRDLQEATADEAARSKSWEPAERTFAPSAPIPYPKPQSVESILAGPSPEVIELEKAEAARIFNKVAGVPAGRKGVSVSSATGQVTTNPGNAPLRALESEGVGPLSKVQAEAFATPTPELQVKVYGEQQLAGQALEKHLAESKAPIDIIASLPPETLALPKMQSAMQAVKAPAVVGKLKKLSVSPVEAHALRSEIGKRINWNPAVVTDANEALKDAYFAIGDQIESSVKGVGPFNKRWQEAYLYAKALKHQLEMIAAGKGL